jgi:tetratricopeptide (TPR) repeat protein
MARHGLELAASALLCLLALGQRAGAQATDPRVAPAEAGTLTEETANAAYEQAKLEQARQAYEKALDRAPSFALAGNLGAVELELGRAREAAGHLALALAWFPADGSAEARSRLEGLLAEAKKRASALPPSPGAASPGHDRSSQGEPGPSLALLVGGTTLGVVALGVGAGLAMLAQERSDVAESKGAALEDLGLIDPCATYPEACDEIRAKQQTRDRLTVGAVVAFGVAGLSTLGTVLYGVLAASPADEPTAQATAVVVPVIELDSQASCAGLTIAGRW